MGHLLPEAAAELGLRADTQVVVGAMDQLAGAVGAGNVVPGSVTETTGSALAIVATVDGVSLDTARRVPCLPHALQERYVLLPYAPTAGLMLKWLRDQVLQDDVAYNALTAQAANVPVVAVDFGYTEQHVSTFAPDIVISHFDALWDAVATLRARG